MEEANRYFRKDLEETRYRGRKEVEEQSRKKIENWYLKADIQKQGAT